MVRYLLLAFATLALVGCATGMRGSSRRICYDAGYQPGTQAFTDCWHGERDRQFAAEGRIIAVGIAAGAAANAPPRDNRLIGDPNRPETLRCVYYTPQGRREMLPVNGVCPWRYGE